MDNKINKPICEWINDLVDQGNSQSERITKLEEGGGSSEDIEELKKCCKKVQQDIQKLYWRTDHTFADLDDIRGDIMNLQDDLEVLSDCCDDVSCKIGELEKCCKYSKDKICELEKRIENLEGCGVRVVDIEKLPETDEEWLDLKTKVRPGDFICDEDVNFYVCERNYPKEEKPNLYISIIRLAKGPRADNREKWHDDSEDPPT